MAWPSEPGGSPPDTASVVLSLLEARPATLGDHAQQGGVLLGDCVVRVDDADHDVG